MGGPSLCRSWDKSGAVGPAGGIDVCAAECRPIAFVDTELIVIAKTDAGPSCNHLHSRSMPLHPLLPPSILAPWLIQHSPYPLLPLASIALACSLAPCDNKQRLDPATAGLDPTDRRAARNACAPATQIQTRR